MTKEEIQQYISENEPTAINKDEVGRWSKRIWQLENSEIIETYIYKYKAEQVQRDKPRDAFKVVNVDRKEI